MIQRSFLTYCTVHAHYLYCTVREHTHTVPYSIMCQITHLVPVPGTYMYLYIVTVLPTVGVVHTFNVYKYWYNNEQILHTQKNILYYIRQQQQQQQSNNQKQ